MTLVNPAWVERQNVQFCETLNDEPSDYPGKTQLKFTLIERGGMLLFHFDDDNWKYDDEPYWLSLGGDREEAKLRLAMKCISVGSKCVASFRDEIAYPSSQYIMQQLPRSEHFPQDLAFNRHEQYEDRATELEFTYHPAHSLEEWRDHVQRRNGAQEFELDQLPWYRPGYWPPGDYEYYWSQQLKWEESTSSLVTCCRRRLPGSTEEGEACIIRKYSMPREFANLIRVVEAYPRFEVGLRCSICIVEGLSFE